MSTLDRQAKKKNQATYSCVHEYDFLGWFTSEIDKTGELMDYDILDIFIHYMCTDPQKKNMLVTSAVIQNYKTIVLQRLTYEERIFESNLKQDSEVVQQMY